MSTQKTEIEVSINCHKCKTGVLKIVAKFTGVDELKLDAEKGLLTVIGSADPVCIAAKLRKAGYFADITSVGPSKEDDDEGASKSPDQKEDCEPLPPYLKQCQCQLVGVSYVTYDSPVCSIL